METIILFDEFEFPKIEGLEYLVNEKIRNKTQIVFLIEDKEGEKFGYYYDDETTSSSNGYKGKNKSFSSKFKINSW